MCEATNHQVYHSDADDGFDGLQQEFIIFAQAWVPGRCFHRTQNLLR